MTKNRIIASLMSNSTSKVKEIYLDSDSTINSASLSSTASAGTTTYASIDSLPVSSNNGDQALVTSTNRLYIYSGSGWYNIALINSTPYWTTEASSSYDLNPDGTSTTITILAVDSEGLPITYIATADSDFNQIATVTKDSDNGRVFIITPTDSENGTAIAGTGTVTFKASDGVNLATTLSTFSILFKIENSNYTSFLLKADTEDSDNQVDTSTNAHTITEYGNVTSTAFTPYHPGGYSYYFAGDTGDYFTIESPTSALSFGTDTDFCIEMWVYPFDASASHILADMRPDSTNGAYLGTLAIGDYPSGSTKALAMDFNGINYLYSSDNAIKSNEWNHLVLNRHGDNINLFVNGTREATTSSEFNFLVGKYRLFKNAYSGGGIADGSGGYIRDYRVVKGDAVYGSGTSLTMPTKPLTAITGTSLLLFQEPYTSDAVGTESVSYVGGETKRFSPFVHEEYTKADYGGSVYFDGSGDNIIVAHDASQVLSNSDFTIEWWMNPQAAGGDNQGVLTKGWASGASAYSEFLVYSYQGNYLFYSSSTGSSWNIFSQFNTGWANWTKQWKHCAVVRNGSRADFFLNGKLTATSTAFGTTTLYNSGQSIAINSSNSGNNVGSAKYISDFRWLVGSAVYDASSASVGDQVFTPPTEPLTAITNTKILTLTNKNDVWEQANGGPVISQYGNVTASNTQRNFLTSSAVYFDGNGDYIDFVKTDGYSFESGVDFTVEGWWYMNSIAGRPHFIGMGTGVDGTPAHYSDWNMYYNSSNNLTFYYYNGSTAIARQFAWTPVINTWYHIAVSRSGTDLKAFINGTQIGSTITDSTNFSGAAGTRPLRLGRWQYGGGTNGYLNGYAQDVRITKGLARYTANFTPPTTEFKG